jgi:2-amino-4-hydroxy-6-hydroxymethyldihydropteridine diphosphokinase
MHKVFLGIGGNVGNKRLNFEKVYSRIEEGAGTILERSPVYETPPWGFYASENFWNQVLFVETKLKPEDLLAVIRRIESSFKRKREPGRYISREMDIDILYYEDKRIDSEELTIPHPLLHQRLFVLVPLNELAPGFIHPVFRKTNRQLLAECKDESDIKKIVF